MPAAWPPPTTEPDFERYFVHLRPPHGSWSLDDASIWTPQWLDAHPPGPLLCSAWGGYGDRSRLLPHNI